MSANIRASRIAPAQGAFAPSWPITALFVLFPLWWLLGMGAFVWPLLALAMLVRLVRSARVSAPRGFGVWLLFLAWVVVSGAQIRGGGAGFFFGYRLVMYLSATVLFLFVYNLRPALRGEQVARALSAFWVVIVLGGFLGILAPGGGFRTVVESLTPEVLRTNELFFRLVHPVFADVQTFLGYRVARPVAPFLYSNYWGSAFALTFPFVIWRIAHAHRAAEQRLFVVLAAAAVVPAVFSLNRGMLLSLAVGLVYAALRDPVRRVRALRNVALGAGLVALLVVVTPLGGLVSDRAETGHSDDGRELLYQQAFALTNDSPWYGYGGPQPVGDDKQLPPVGTQGQFWNVMVSQGYVGLALFLTWFVTALVRTRRLTGSVGRWCHVTLLVFLIQLPVYDMLPYQFHLVMMVAGYALAEVDAEARARRRFSAAATTPGRPATTGRTPGPVPVPVPVTVTA